MKSFIIILFAAVTSFTYSQTTAFPKFVPYESGKVKQSEKTETINIRELGNEQPARWLSVDPLADKYPGWSPYNYCMNNPLRFTDPNGTWVPEYDKQNNTVSAKYQEGDTYEGLYSQLGISGEQFTAKYGVDLSKEIAIKNFDITSYALKQNGFSADNSMMNCFSSSLYGSGAISEEMPIQGGFQFTEEAIKTFGFEKVEQQSIGTVTTWKDANNVTNHAAIYLIKDISGTPYFVGRPGPNSDVNIQSSKTTNSFYPNFQQTFLRYTSSQPKF